MTLHVVNPRSAEGSLTGRKVLAIFAGFFGIVFAVNGYFLYAALSTHTGVVAVEPYRKGLAYNERVAAAERQADLKWSENIAVDRSGRVALSLAAADGSPVRGLLVAGTIGRPVDGSRDVRLAFRETAEGYLADAGLIAEGSWIVNVEVRRAPSDEPVFRSRRRLWLKP